MNRVYNRIRGRLPCIFTCGISALLVITFFSAEYYGIVSPTKNIFRTEGTSRTYDVIADQNRRQRIFRENCFKHHLGSSRRNGNNQIFINHTGEVLYCFAPKAGCSNLKKLWYDVTGRKPRKSIHHDQYHTDVGIKRYQGYFNRNNTSGLSGYYKVAFVRHPWVRLISGYRDKFVSGRLKWEFPSQVFGTLKWKKCLSLGFRYWKSITIEMSNKTHGTGSKTFIAKELGDGSLSHNPSRNETNCFITFKDFIDHILKMTAKKTNAIFDRHWLPLYQVCDACFMKYDFIGKMEHIQQDFDYINPLLFGGKASLSPPRTSVQSDLEMVKQYFREISCDAFRKLLPVYRLDFLLFDYEPLNEVLFPDCNVPDISL